VFDGDPGGGGTAFDGGDIQLNPGVKTGAGTDGMVKVSGSISASGVVHVGTHDAGVKSLILERYSTQYPYAHIAVGREDTEDGGSGISFGYRRYDGDTKQGLIISSSGYTKVGTGLSTLGSIPVTHQLTVAGDFSTTNSASIGTTTDSGKILTVEGDISASGDLYLGAPGYGKKLVLEGDNTNGKSPLALLSPATVNIFPLSVVVPMEALFVVLKSPATVS
jgi:hypothetical protein